MTYIFSETENYDMLRTVDPTETELAGNQVVVREYPDSVITDTFHIVQKYKTELYEGNYYIWYVIDRHYRNIDYSPRFDKENADMKKVQDDNDAMLVDQEYRLTMMELGV